MKSLSRSFLMIVSTLGVSALLFPCRGGAAAPQASTAAKPASAQAPGAALQTRPLTAEERADIFMARKSYADAVDYYNRALKKSNFRNPVVWNKLGIAYQQQINYRSARKAYNTALHQQKSFAEPWNNLGTVYFMENRFKKSVKYYERALKLKPEAASFHTNLGASYFRLKRFPEAMDEYRTALSLDPNILTEHASFGTVLEARNADPTYHFYLAKIFAELGRVDEAVRYLRRAFEDGFTDFKKVDEDPDFQKISQDPAFVELMKNRPVAIKD